ncbi:RnaseH-domain-containing protein, partial [Dendrothele bispora CBS 962.96]
MVSRLDTSILSSTKKPPPPVFPPKHEEDFRLQKLLQSRSSYDSLCTKAYGEALHDDPSPSVLNIWTDGSCTGRHHWNRRAGAGVFFGPNNLRNSSLRVPGKQSNNRGELYAILGALVKSAKSRERELRIYSDSVYAIRSIVWWGPRNAARGWRCANGDILKQIAYWLKNRRTPVKFIHVRSHSGIQYNEEADRLAKLGTSL